MAEQFRLARELARGRLQSNKDLYNAVNRLYDFGFARTQKLQTYQIDGLVKNTHKTMKTILVGTEGDAYQFCSLAYSNIRQISPVGEILPAMIQSFEERARRTTNLVVVKSKALAARDFQKLGYFILPTVSFELDLRVPVDTIVRRMSRRRRRDIDKVEALEYSYNVCRKDCRSFNLFYWDMYRPFAEQRFGKAAFVKSYAESMTIYRHNGGIAFAKENEKPVSGILFQIRGKTLCALCYGKHRGIKQEFDLSGQATLFYLIKWAKSKGMEHLDYGICVPFFTDGIFTYKKEWGMSICKESGYHVYALKLCSINEACLSFLQQSPFIVLDGEKLRGIVFLDHKPGVLENQQFLSEYMLLGLDSLIVISCCKELAAETSFPRPSRTPEMFQQSTICGCLSDLCLLMSKQGLDVEVSSVATVHGNSHAP